jgi:predicted HNH restriction endonuclease
MTYHLPPHRIGRSQYRTEAEVINNVIGPTEIDERSDAIFADLLDQVELFQDSLEGRRLLREHIIRERDPTLIRQFKNALRSFKCSICNFDYGETYGPIGKGFIEAHHVEPIGMRKDESSTSLNDLIAVCSNCHRMLHRKSPPYSAKEITEFLRSTFERRGA